MGRSSGFIAAHATLSSSDVDLCLIPEVPIELEGENGCLPHLMRRVKDQGYAVVVVAEVSTVYTYYADENGFVVMIICILFYYGTHMT